MPASRRSHSSKGVKDTSAPFTRFVRVRPFLQRFAAVGFLVVLVTSLSVALAITFRESAAKQEQARRDQDRFATEWQTKISQRLGEAISLATAAGAFAAGGAIKAPNHTASAAERIQFVNNKSWEITAATFFDQVPGMLSLQLQPSGIIAQMWPPNTAPVGLDVFNRAITHDAYVALALGKKAEVNGPVQLAQGGLGILARYPVYLTPDKTFDSWWGAGVAVCRISDLLGAMNIAADCKAQGYDFYVYATSLTNKTAVPQFILSSLAQDKAPLVARNGVVVRAPAVDPANALDVAFAKQGGLPSAVPPDGIIAAIVIGSVVGALVFVAIGAALTYATYKSRHVLVPHQSSEAQETVMALVSIKRLSWWQDHSDPESLQSDLLRFEQCVAAFATSNDCYSSGRISDGCVLVVGKSHTNMRAFASDIAEKLSVEGTTATRLKAGEGSSLSPSGNTSQRNSSHKRSQSAAAAAEVSHERTDSEVSGGSGTGGKQAHGIKKTFEIGVTLHYGLLKSTYDAVADRFTFHGPAFICAAMAVDQTRGGEVSLTEAFADKFNVAVKQAITTMPLEDDTVLMIIHSKQQNDLEPSMSMSRNSNDSADKRREQKAKKAERTQATEEDRSVATVVSAQTGAVLRKRIAVLALEFLPPDAVPAAGTGAGGTSRAHSTKRSSTLGATATKSLPIPDFPEMLRDIDAGAKEFGGEVLSVTDSMVFVVFNARVSANNVAARAIHLDEALRLQFRRVRMVSVIATGFAHIATVDAHLMCIGSTVTRARRLLVWATQQTLETALQTKHKSFTYQPESSADATYPFTLTPLVDLASAETVRQHFELQCLGPVGVYSSLVYSVVKEWAMDEDDDEWLYRLQKLEEESAFSALNAAFEALHAGDLEKGKEMAVKVLGAVDKRAFAEIAISNLQKTLERESTAALSKKHQVLQQQRSASNLKSTPQQEGAHEPLPQANDADEAASPTCC